MDHFKALRTGADYLRIPVNKTATMRLLLELVQRGNTRWTAGTIPFAKAEALALKFDRKYATSMTPTQRARRKRAGEANSVLVMYPAGAQSPHVLWWLLVSPGSGPVVDEERLSDCLAPRQALVYPDATGRTQYVLDHTQRPRIQGGGRRWTWSVTPERLAEHQARLLELARPHGARWQRHDDLQAHIDALTRMPQFHGVREQVKALIFEARRLAPLQLADKIAWPGNLPIMSKAMDVYRKPEPMLLPELVVRMSTVARAAAASLADEQ